MTIEFRATGRSGTIMLTASYYVLCNLKLSTGFCLAVNLKQTCTKNNWQMVAGKLLNDFSFNPYPARTKSD